MLSLSLDDLVREALREDIGAGDVTTAAIVRADARCRVSLIAKEAGVLSGIDAFRLVFEILSADIREWTALSNGDSFTSGDTIVAFEGATAAVLGGERVALNFVQRLSGTATLTRKHVDAIADLDTRICDTRKTTPLLRALEKRAVLHGGGVNHRFGLYDGILIKENHIAAADGITAAVERARDAAQHLLKIEVEVSSLDELDESLAAQVDAVLLDNMDIDTMREAVRRARHGDTLIEASGNVTLETVRAIAETGVDLISVGALTHSAKAIDLSQLIDHVH